MKLNAAGHIGLALSVLLFAAVALAEDRPAKQPAPDAGKPAPAVAFQGRIESVDVDGRRLTLNEVTMIGKQKERVGGSVTFTVGQFARIWLDGREAQLRDLHEGFSVRVEGRLGNTPEVRGVDLIEAHSR
jgi:hypothetical protein